MNYLKERSHSYVLLGFFSSVEERSFTGFVGFMSIDCVDFMSIDCVDLVSIGCVGFISIDCVDCSLADRVDFASTDCVDDSPSTDGTSSKYSSKSTHHASPALSQENPSSPVTSLTFFTIFFPRSFFASTATRFANWSLRDQPPSSLHGAADRLAALL